MQNTIELKEMTLRQLVEYYNKLTGKNLKKFSDKATAIIRVEMAEVEHKVTRGVTQGADGIKKETSTPNISKKRTIFTEQDTIECLVPKNPKRGGTRAFTTFEVYMSAHKEELTVERFFESGGNTRDLHHDSRKGYIKVFAPNGDTRSL